MYEQWASVCLSHSETDGPDCRAAVAQAASHDCGSAAARRNKLRREGVALYVQLAGVGRRDSPGKRRVWVYRGRWRLEVAPTELLLLVMTACVKKHQRHQKHQEHQTGLDYPKLMDEASPSNAFSK